jgi:cobaltochelatase CobN
MRTTIRTELRTVEEAIWQESRTTLLNPKYIAALQDGGASSAEVFAETFRNTFGWNALRPEAIDAQLWDGLNDVYVEDIHGLDMENYFREKNPYALQEMTAVMLESVRKGYWQPGTSTVQRIAELHAELVRDHDPGCSGFVCDNASLRKLIAANLTPELQTDYNDAIDQTLVGAARETVEGMRLERQTENVDRLAEALRENQTPIIAVVVLILFFGGALYFGARRRRRS